MRCWPNLAICKFILCIWFNFMTSLGGQSLKKGGREKSSVGFRSYLASFTSKSMFPKRGSLSKDCGKHPRAKLRKRAGTFARGTRKPLGKLRMLENVKHARSFSLPVSTKNVLHLKICITIHNIT